ncbi:hypothetical protein F2Q70_00040328 [Brassica cretica]|uniref:Uncharacterized protein n=1 Tax=Brassica cretica TaxID=69181 RepID=A0A8S9JZE7_BRACR|nr:hypothetical protein F2Q70_00040328 [Brassica cretica]
MGRRRELRITDGESVNFNGHFPSPSPALISLFHDENSIQLGDSSPLHLIHVTALPATGDDSDSESKSKRRHSVLEATHRPSGIADSGRDSPSQRCINVTRTEHSAQTSSDAGSSCGPVNQDIKPTSQPNQQITQLSSEHVKSMINVQRRKCIPRTSTTAHMTAHGISTNNRFGCLGSCAEVS